MKKLMLKILVGIFAVCMLATTLVGCSDAKWKNNLSNWGAGDVVGGFVGVKGNYVFYINGNAKPNANNKFGTPVKGALMAADKNDLSKSKLVVPKLFVGSDYNAGIYIYGDYVYYGTPNTDKNAEGEIAYTDLVFTRTKLDGSGTKRLFVVDGLATEYRILENEGDVYIVYYDKEDSALKVYSVSSDTHTVIASQDVKTKNMVALDSYKFTDNGDEFTVCYTVKVFKEKYYEEKGENREVASYNKVYAYKVGQSTNEDGVRGELVADGEQSNVRYSMSLVKDGKLFYNSNKEENVKTYYYDFSIENPQDRTTPIDNSSAVSDASILVGDNIVYNIVEGKIQETVLVGNANVETRNVALVENARSLLAIREEGGVKYAYYFDDASNICRIELYNIDAISQKVSEGSVNSSWYKPQFITLGEKTYLFYCDNSSEGLSYVKYVDIDSVNVVGEDTDDDSVEDTFKYTGHKFLARITNQDSANMVTSKITAITGEFVNGVLPYETDAEGKLYVQCVIDAQKAYNALSDEAKKLVSSDSKNLLEKYKKAVEMANLYEKLSDMRAYVDGTLTEDQINELKDSYNAVKSKIKSFTQEENYSSVSSLIGKNRLWCFQEADAEFGSK